MFNVSICVLFSVCTVLCDCQCLLNAILCIKSVCEVSVCVVPGSVCELLVYILWLCLYYSVFVCVLSLYLISVCSVFLECAYC